MAKKQHFISENSAKILKGLRKQVVSLGQIHYESKKEENFKEWKQRTLYLARAGFGDGQQLSELERAIEKMPEKDDTEGQFSGYNRYKYWLEGEGEDENDGGVFNQEIWDEDYKKAKNWIQKLIKLYIEELELLAPTETKLRSGAKNVLIATQTTNIKIDINTEIKNLIHYVHENEADQEKAKEAEEKIKQLGDELGKNPSKWSVIKDLLIWIANYSKDLFIKVLPILLDHYNK